MKRIVLFLMTNLAIMVVLSITVRLLGADQYLTQQGLNVNALLIFAAIFGFGGSFISLLMSKWIAKRSTGAIAWTADSCSPRSFATGNSSSMRYTPQSSLEGEPPSNLRLASPRSTEAT